MHIPDGYLGPKTYGGLWLVMLPVWYASIKKIKSALKSFQIPLLALSSAFSFVVMMFNVPIPGGSTGHATGATLAAILLGPWTAVISISIVLLVQAFVFGDGGITAIGANCFNMAFVNVFAGYWIYRLFAGRSPVTSKRTVFAAVTGAYAGINIAALFAGIEFGIQPYIYRSPDGKPIYCPFPLKTSVPAMALSHLAVFGVLDAVITGLVIVYLQKSNPRIIGGSQ